MKRNMKSILLCFKYFPTYIRWLSTISLKLLHPIHTSVSLWEEAASPETSRDPAKCGSFSKESIQERPWDCPTIGVAERRGAILHIHTLKNNICTETESHGPAHLTPRCLSSSLRWEKETSFPCCFSFPVHLIMMLCAFHLQLLHPLVLLIPKPLPTGRQGERQQQKQQQ